MLTVPTEQYPLQHALRAHDLEEEHENIVVGLDGLGAEDVDDGEGDGVPDVEAVEGADGAGDGAFFFLAAAVGEADEGGLDPGGGLGPLDNVAEAGVDGDLKTLSFGLVLSMLTLGCGGVNWSERAC